MNLQLITNGVGGTPDPATIRQYKTHKTAHSGQNATRTCQEPNAERHTDARTYPVLYPVHALMYRRYAWSKKAYFSLQTAERLSVPGAAGRLPCMQYQW